MAKICLDSDILIDLLRNRHYAKEFMEQHETVHTLGTTYINLFELYHGAMLSNNITENLEFVKKIEERLILLNLSKEAAQGAGEIAAKLDHEGMKIDFKDILIGSIARTEQWSLKTNNLKHFKRIEGLELFQET